MSCAVEEQRHIEDLKRGFSRSRGGRRPEQARWKNVIGMNFMAGHSISSFIRAARMTQSFLSRNHEKVRRPVDEAFLVRNRI